VFLHLSPQPTRASGPHGASPRQDDSPGAIVLLTINERPGDVVTLSFIDRSLRMVADLAFEILNFLSERSRAKASSGRQQSLPTS
jgi:hypothetical protein